MQTKTIIFRKLIDLKAFKRTIDKFFRSKFNKQYIYVNKIIITFNNNLEEHTLSGNFYINSKKYDDIRTNKRIIIKEFIKLTNNTNKKAKAGDILIIYYPILLHYRFISYLI